MPLRTDALGRTTALVACLCAVVGLAAGCGGSPPDADIPAPLVRNMSPQLSPIDFATLIQNPTFTNSALTVSTDPNYPGKIVIFFQDDTVLNGNTIFLGGNPFLGPDPAALQVTREVPGVGNDPILIDVVVESDRIICQPLPPFAIDNGDGTFTTNLPDGQYTVGVFRNIQNIAGDPLIDGPVFHSFNVGDNDILPPRVVTTSPANGEQNVGAGVPPAPPPSGVPSDAVADISTTIFGETTPDVVIRFSEGVRAATINSSTVVVVDAGFTPPPGGPLVPPQIIPAPGFPKLKSQEDQATLPSNGHEVIFRSDAALGGFPFGTQIQVTVVGSYDNQANKDADPTGMNPDNTAPVEDLSGNKMEISDVRLFQTIAPPDLPQNPLPEYSIWWSANDRVGALDTINHAGIVDGILNPQPVPAPIEPNVLPDFTDEISTNTTIPRFDPIELIVDPRHNVLGTCHTFVYIQSKGSGQIAILNSRDSVPVALIRTPTPGGIGLSALDNATDTLVATNSSANTFTAFNLSGLTVGQRFINAPIFISKVQPTGNTPQAIVISDPPTVGSTFDGLAGDWNVNGGIPGPSAALIMWADFSDGAVNTIGFADDEPVRTFSLGAGSGVNDISLSPCLGGLLLAAISSGGGLLSSDPGTVSYYLSGPGCSTGTQNVQFPDAIVGALPEPLDAPAGLDQNANAQRIDPSGVFFIVAESGSSRNAVTTIGLETGAITLPRRLARFENIGANPTSVAHKPSWTNPSVNDVTVVGIGNPSCNYSGIFLWQWVTTLTGIIRLQDFSMNPMFTLYVASSGSGQIRMVNLTQGPPLAQQGTSAFSVDVPLIRQVGSQTSQ